MLNLLPPPPRNLNRILLLIAGIVLAISLGTALVLIVRAIAQAIKQWATLALGSALDGLSFSSSGGVEGLIEFCLWLLLALAGFKLLLRWKRRG